MNPASTMKLADDLRRSRAARPRLPLAHRGVRRRAASPTARSTATSVLKGYGDPKVTIWSSFRHLIGGCAPRDSTTIRGDLVLDRSVLRAGRARSGSIRRRAAQALQRRPRRAARQLQERALRVRARAPRATLVDVRAEPALRQPLTLRGAPRAHAPANAATGAAALQASCNRQPTSAEATFGGRYPGSVRRARLVRRAARSSALRAARSSRATGVRAGAASPAACATAAQPPGAKSAGDARSRRRSTT